MNALGRLRLIRESRHTEANVFNAVRPCHVVTRSPVRSDRVCAFHHSEISVQAHMVEVPTGIDQGAHRLILRPIVNLIDEQLVEARVRRQGIYQHHAVRTDQQQVVHREYA